MEAPHSLLWMDQHVTSATRQEVETLFNNFP